MLDPATFLAGRQLLTVIDPDRRLSFIAPDDVGKAAAAAIADPARFSGATIELGGDVRSLDEITAILSRLDGKPYEARSLPIPEAIAEGLHPGLAHGFDLLNVAPLLAEPAVARSYGLEPQSFEAWAREQRA